MDKLTRYRSFLQTFLTRYTSGRILRSSEEEVEVQLRFDTERDRYQWLNVAWRDNSIYIYNCLMHFNIHFNIKDGKIWLQVNRTDCDPAAELVALGVPREDIVLGLQPLKKRPYADYGIA